MERKIEALREQMMARSVPCDAELQELMHQIDIMVNNKKFEWEKKLQALEKRMTIRDQELATAQSKLDQKSQEVGLLRQKLDSLQKTKYEMAQNYDAQLQALKTQFAKLTQGYEKLQLHQLKQNKAHGMGKCTEIQEPPFPLSSLNQKLEEFRAKSREWDKQETLYQNHLVSLDAQQKLLSEKCNLFQKQAQNCQNQIRCQKLKQEDGGSCSQCKTEHLGIQKDIFPLPSDRNEFFMEELKSTVSEIAVSRNRLQEENLKLQQEVKMYQRKCQNIEARLIEVKNELQSREDLLNMVELECQQLRKEVAKMEEYRNKEENQMKLQSAYAQCIKDLEIKKTQILALERQQENQQEELNEIRDHLYQAKQSHRSEVERMRTELFDLTEELHQKEITIATIVEKAAVLERQLQMEFKIKEKMFGKQKARHETTKMKASFGEFIQQFLSPDLVQERLASNTRVLLLGYARLWLKNTTIFEEMMDLPKSELKMYLDTMDIPGHEKERLHNELVKLPKDADLPWLVEPITYFGTNPASQTLRKMQEKEEKLLENEGEQALQSTAYKHFGYYRTQIPAWHGQGEIDNSSSLPSQQPSRDREPIVDGRSPSPPEAYSTHYSTYFSERTKSDILPNYVYAVEEGQLSSQEALFPATATEMFLQEEEKRARDFELVLNSHIDELQKQTEHTLKKYSSLNKQSRHR